MAPGSLATLEFDALAGQANAAIISLSLVMSIYTHGVGQLGRYQLGRYQR